MFVHTKIYCERTNIVASKSVQLLVSRSPTTFFLLSVLGREKRSGTLPIETAVLTSTLVGVSVECDFLDVLNAIDRDASTAVSMGSGPDPFFPPQYKRKKSDLATRD